MFLADTSIKRPVFTTMVILAAMVLGVFGYNVMSVDLFPDIDFPFVVVSTMYPGAGPETVESEVTVPVEEAVNTISAIEHLTSTSYEGYSLVLIQFELNVDAVDKATEVREKIAAIRSALPDGIEEPIIQRWDPESMPIMSLTISGPRSLKEITTLTKDIIIKRLESVDGVGSVGLVGGAEREIQIVLDRQKMEAFAISAMEIVGAIRAANLEIPAGRLERGRSELTIRTLGRIADWRDFENLVVARRQGHPVHVRDIATVVDGIAERRSLAFYDENEAVGLDIIRQVGANTVDVAEHVKQKLVELGEELPDDISVNIATDNSIFIEEAVADVIMNIEIGGTLAVLVIFLFLASWRTTLISGLAIPTSIVATFFGMYMLGFTVNFMSLLGLSIAVGLLIDDAIVVVENIYRHFKLGEAADVAASRATSEIGMAVIATTFSIIVVFVPIGYMGGIVGQYFQQFAITVAISIAFSLFIAFTLTPMLFSVLARNERPGDFAQEKTKSGDKPKRGIFVRFDAAYNRLADKYRGLLGLALRHRFLTMLVATVLFIGSLFLGSMTGVEFMPLTDQGEIYIAFEAAPGTSLEKTRDEGVKLERLARSYPEIRHIYTTIGSGQSDVSEGVLVLKLAPRHERQRSVFAIIDDLRTELRSMPGLFTSINTEGGEHGSQVQISVTGDNLKVLAHLAAAVEDSMKSVPGAVDVKNSLEGGRPEIQLEIDRARASELGIDIYSLASTLQYLVDGQEVTTYKEGDDEFDVIIQLDAEDRQDSWDIASLRIASTKDVPGVEDFFVPLNQVARLAERSGPVEINRYDRQRQVLISANTAGAFAGDVRTAVDEKVAKIHVPPGYKVGAIGIAEWQAESFNRIFLALMASILFIYMVLASQYESFVDPLSIMISLPLALVGAMIGLLIGGTSVSLISLIGVVLLMGLVTKNAILLIDFVKQARRRGDDRTTAILKAGPIRLRPILMTAAATVLGLTPLALGLGEGAELRKPMAHAVIGGMISSTMLTLVVVPVVYTLIEDFFGLFSRKKKRLGAEPAGMAQAVADEKTT
ncbi:efflux RND transporter permease subunit [Candidatus Zixiibacteriota bacterium]